VQEEGVINCTEGRHCQKVRVEGVENLGLEGGCSWKGWIDHGTGLVEVNGVGLEVQFGCRFIWVLGAGQIRLKWEGGGISLFRIGFCRAVMNLCGTEVENGQKQNMIVVSFVVFTVMDNDDPSALSTTPSSS
jgi:hypothetical protein